MKKNQIKSSILLFFLYASYFHLLPNKMHTVGLMN